MSEQNGSSEPAAAPIAGGDQPRPVWVRRDMDSNLGVSLGAGPLPN